ncbi:MAG TPA: MnmC family methyltransferase [Verrucomicrobiae bacterium]|nr:MnmC family methyltransferase [Verrucomicrobiae bacterium]
MSSSSGYRIVKLTSGAHSVHSLEHGETFHPGVGPVAEAEALYVRQLELLEWLRCHTGEFVVWDVGLGAAANAVTLLRAARDVPAAIRIVSFDHTLEAIQFALEHTGVLEYLVGYEAGLRQLLRDKHVSFRHGALAVNWTLHLADFPSLIAQPAAETFPKPHVILFDAFSPAKNPAMWTQPLFANVFKLLDPKRPCVLPTYSRSTLLRVTLLLAGFFVGIGHPTGEKEETTMASNTLDLIKEPLERRWLQRARRSTSAEPMWDAAYRQLPLSKATLQRLEQHPQFVQGLF